MATRDNVWIGPAGWSYPDWGGVVYPCPTLKGFHALEYLAQFFDTVEINVSFYRPLPPQFAPSWLKKVVRNPRFRFTAKLWQRFTHEREPRPTSDEICQARDGMAPLLESGKLAALLVQFPWSFRRTDDNRHWLDLVCKTFADYPLVVEVRHASWDVPEMYEALAQRGIAFCNIDQPQFHDAIPPSERVTSRIGYVRLHGRNYQDWFRDDAGRDERYDYLYTGDELKPWLERIEHMRKTADEVYVITNNHYRGQAVVNSFEIQAGLGKKDFVIPQHLIEHYPQLARLSGVQAQGQAGLPLDED